MMTYPFLNMTPDAFHDAVHALGGFTSEGQIWWWAIEKLTKGNALHLERVTTDCDPRNNSGEMRIDTAVYRIGRYLDLGCPTILCVDALHNDRIADHAVLAVDYKLDIAKLVDFLIIDPAYGDKVWFSKRYGNIRENLYGYVGFSLPTAQKPDQTKENIQQAFWKACQLSRGRGQGVYEKEIWQSMLS
jgi:hypothetical protein